MSCFQILYTTESLLNKCWEYFLFWWKSTMQPFLLFWNESWTDLSKWVHLSCFSLPYILGCCWNNAQENSAIKTTQIQGHLTIKSNFHKSRTMCLFLCCIQFEDHPPNETIFWAVSQGVLIAELYSSQMKLGISQMHSFFWAQIFSSPAHNHVNPLLSGHPKRGT